MPTRRPPHPLVAWGIFLAVAGAPLVYSNALVARFTLPKFLVLSLAVLLCALGSALSPRAKMILPRSAAFALLACAAALGLSAFFSQDRFLSVVGRYDSYAYGLWPMALLAGLFAAASSLDLPARRRTLDVCLGAGTLAGAFGALQWAGQDLLPGIGVLPAGGRAVSTLGSPVDLGAYLLLLLPLALHRALSGHNRALGWVSFFSISAGLLATISRAAWLGAAAAVVAYFTLEDPRRLRARAPKLLAAVLLAALAGAGALRLSGRLTLDSDAQRPLIWRAAWEIFLDHPLLGTGPDTFESDFRRYRSARYVRLMGSERFQAHAHNDLLQSMATAGLAGTGAYLALLGALCLAARKTLEDAKSRPETAALCGGLAGLFLVLKLDPVSLEVLLIAAVFSGLLLPAAVSEEGPTIPPPLIALCALTAAASLAGAWRLVAADLHARQGLVRGASARPEEGASSLKRAMGLNPCELSYQILFVNQLQDRVNSAAPALRAELLREAESLTSGDCRPDDVNTHYIRGIVSYMRAQVGMPEKFSVAAAALDQALERDPFFAPLLRSRAEVARRMGDKSLAETLDARSTWPSAP